MSVTVKVDRLNLGSGRFPLDGWTNVDLVCEADIQADFRELTFEGVSQVRMIHMLEHISWRETDAVLKQIRSWMVAGGRLEVEVPDMVSVLALGTRHPLWFKYVYGDQSHEGEYHLAGFTADSLSAALVAAGWSSVTMRRFVSGYRGRDGMPCLLAGAFA